MRFDKILAVTVLISCCAFLFSCEKESVQKNSPAPAQVSGAISKPVIEPASQKTRQTDVATPLEAGPTVKQLATPAEQSPSKIMELAMVQDLKYDAKGKIDPFTPLVRKQEANTSPMTAPPVDEEPKRPLTPLEKMEISQLKLVAVILMNDKKIAMVEEATGKGYEVGIGTYIGKNFGQVTQINPSSILIKEIVKDFKGNRQERFQEMKLHKSGD